MYMYESTEKAISYLKGSYFPSLPDAVFKIKYEIESGQPNLRQIASYISSEAELSLSFIEITKELIGSSLGRTPSVYDIVSRLGYDSVYEILIAAFIERQLVRTEFDRSVVDMCRRVGIACYFLARDVRLINQSEAYLSGLIHGISFIFLNRIDSKFEYEFSQFITNPVIYYRRLGVNHGFTIGHTDMVLANYWKMKRTQLKAFSLNFVLSLNPKVFKKTHHKKAYQLSRIIMLGHIYVAETYKKSYVSESMKALRVQVEKELSLPRETLRLVQACLINYEKKSFD